MHNYEKDVNWLDEKITAAKITVVLTSGQNYKYVFHILNNFISDCHRVLYNADKEKCKEIKSALFDDVKLALTNNVDKIQSQYIYKMATNRTLAQEQRDNLLITMARWPEFYLRSEEDMMLIGQNLSDHKEEINAITYIDKEGKQICPYRVDDYHDDLDLKGTLKAQNENVKRFLSDKEIYIEFDYNDIMRELEEFEERVLYNNISDPVEANFIKSIRYIRSRSKKCEQDILNYINGHAKYDDFTLSESRSPSSDNEAIMQVLHSLGWKRNTCPMVLDNLIHGRYDTLKIKKQDGQVQVDFDFEGFTVAVGLGPARKIRFVFNCHADIQNSISFLADLIQDADKFCDDFMQAYNDQQKQINLDMDWITDAFCTDATGYSDYLTRAIYAFLLRLYGFSDLVINYIMSVFRMPIIIDNVKYNVEFGSMQGCKLLVFIMNHANRLIGIIAKRIGKYRVDARSNAGDDVEVHRFEGTYTEKDINTEIAVFAYFNCPCNEQKTAWLSRDGYFDFCSKYYKLNDSRKGVHSITGLPPKIAGKQIVCIGQFAEMFKVMDVPGTKHRSCSESWDLLYPLLRNDLEDGCLLPNIYKEYNQTLDEKISNAKDIWYEVGGLADEDKMDTYKTWKLVRYKFKKMLEHYVFDPKGIFMIVNLMDDEFKKTELYKALGTVQRYTYGQIVSILELIDGVEADKGLDSDDIKILYKKVMKLERDIVHGTSISRNVSTYHRKTLTRDIDTFLPVDRIDIDLETQYHPSNLFTASALLAAVSKEERTVLNNIQMYIRMKILYDKYSNCVVSYSGVGDSYLAIDEGDGLRVRLESKHSGYKYKFTNGFKMPSELNNPEIAELYSLIDYYGVGDLYGLINGLLYNDIESTMHKITARSMYDKCMRDRDRIVRRGVQRILSGFNR